MWLLWLLPNITFEWLHTCTIQIFSKIIKKPKFRSLVQSNWFHFLRIILFWQFIFDNKILLPLFNTTSFEALIHWNRCITLTSYLFLQWKTVDVIPLIGLLKKGNHLAYSAEWSKDERNKNLISHFRLLFIQDTIFSVLKFKSI